MLGVNPEAQFAEQVLPVPPAAIAAKRFSRDAPEMQQTSLGFVHDSGFYKALGMPSR